MKVKRMGLAVGFSFLVLFLVAGNHNINALGKLEKKANEPAGMTDELAGKGKVWIKSNFGMIGIVIFTLIVGIAFGAVLI